MHEIAADCTLLQSAALLSSFVLPQTFLVPEYRNSPGTPAFNPVIPSRLATGAG